MKVRMLRRLLPALLVALATGCVEMRDPTLDEMDPGRHARDHTHPPRSETWSVLDLLATPDSPTDP